MSGDQQRWSALDLEDLVERFEEEIVPDWRAETEDTERTVPTTHWLDAEGYGGLRYALREHHDLTYTGFLEDAVCFEPDGDDPRGSGGENHLAGTSIRDESTRTALESYFRRREERELLAESTLASRRSRWARWLETYRDVHGTDALVPAASDRSDEAAERQRCRRVLDVVAADLGTDASRLTYLSDVRAVYSWLDAEGFTAFNPLSGAEREYGWERPDPDNPALSPAQVGKLHEAAETPGERLLVVGLAGWGLRPSELASLHVRQLALDGDDAHIAFDERKNGPGTVALLYGQDAVEARIDEVAAGDDWMGYLFPSASSASGHVVPDTIRARFRELAERGDVQVAGETPTPKMGRRFWYSAYTEASAEVLEEIEHVAEEQGSSSAEVVRENYLSEGRRRQLRRRRMRERLGEAFGGGQIG